MIIDYSLFSHPRFINLGYWTHGELVLLENNFLENSRDI